MRNPNNLNFDNIFRTKRLFDDPEKQESLLNKVKDLIDPLRPREEDFKDIYPEEEIEKDLAEIQTYQAEWKQDATLESQSLKNIADIYEAVLLQQIEQNDWFGENFMLYPTARYDDVKHGIDTVAEFIGKDNSREHLGIGIDVVFTNNPQRVKEKIENIKQMIRNGNLGRVKYFQDNDGNKKELFVPKIIIGSRLPSAEKLITTWASKTPDRNKKLAKDPTQTKIILEAYMQLYYFYDYATHIQQEEIALAYARSFNIFADIYKEKEDIIKEQINEISGDIVYLTIQRLYMDVTQKNLV